MVEPAHPASRAWPPGDPVVERADAEHRRERGRENGGRDLLARPGRGDDERGAEDERHEERVLVENPAEPRPQCIHPVEHRCVRYQDAPAIGRALEFCGRAELYAAHAPGRRRASTRWSARLTPPGSETTSIGSTGPLGALRLREDAEDLVQETYARVLARPRLLRNEDDLGYLLRALRNTFLTQKRTESRRLRPGPLPEQLDLVADPHVREPQAAVEAGELYAAIAALPDDFRDVLVAVDVAGLTYGEAAHALRIREGTVMSRSTAPASRSCGELKAARPDSCQSDPRRRRISRRCQRSDEHPLARRRLIAVGLLARDRQRGEVLR